MMIEGCHIANSDKTEKPFVHIFVRYFTQDGLVCSNSGLGASIFN